MADKSNQSPKQTSVATKSVTRDCAFQFAVANKGWLDKSPIIADTDLITLDEAKELWNKYLPEFIKRMEDEQRPEMAIWIDMDSNINYSKTLKHIHADDCVVKHGLLFVVTEEQVTEL